MPDSLEKIILDNLESVSTIVHVGCGLCRELRAFEKLQPKQVVLVEPNPEICRELQQAGGGLSVNVVRGAVSERDGTGQLQITNDSRFSMLGDIEDLVDFYPSLKVLESKTVKTMTLATLLDDLELTSAERNLLIVEAQGREDVVVGSASKADLKKFSFILVRCLRNKSLPDDSISRALKAAEFSVVKISQPNSPFDLYVGQKNEVEITLESEGARRSSELEQAVSEYEYRHSLFEGELAKAETQIELIKDIVFRDESD